MSKKEKKEVSTRVTNRKFAESDELFKKACTDIGIKPTKRQASKFRLGRGLAFKGRKQVRTEEGE